MRVVVRRTGGFAGLAENIKDLDTAQLDAAAARLVEQLVQSLGFFSMPATIAGGGIGADMFHYEITVSEGDRQHTVAFDDDESRETAPLRSFVDTLLQVG
jgi:hypothetical protein